MNKTVGYAIEALAQIAAHRGPLPLASSTISDRTDIPPRYLLQILRHLAAAGLIDSRRGVQGGYKLAKPADRISLLEICEAVEGPLVPSAVEAEGLTAASQKLFAGALADLTDDARRRLSGVTLDKLHAAKA